MLMIRLQRVGRKHEPVFRLVLTDSKNGPKSGKFLEILGNYDARKKERAEFKEERVKHWISKGAKLSDTVHNVLVDKKVVAGKKINNLPKKRPIISEKQDVNKTDKTEINNTVSIEKGTEDIKADSSAENVDKTEVAEIKSDIEPKKTVA